MGTAWVVRKPAIEYANLNEVGEAEVMVPIIAMHFPAKAS